MMNVMFKILSSVMMLLSVMIIPYFVGLKLMPPQLQIQPQITIVSSVSDEVLGNSNNITMPSNLNYIFSIQSLANSFGIYAIFTLIFTIIYRKLKR